MFPFDSVWSLVLKDTASNASGFRDPPVGSQVSTRRHDELMMLTSGRRFARRNRDIDTVLVCFSFFRSLLELCYEPTIWLVKSLFTRTLSACAEQNDLPLDPSVSSHAGRKLPCSTPAADGSGVQVARRVAFFRHLNSGSQPVAEPGLTRAPDQIMTKL